MGGDHAPSAVILGSVDALRERPGAFTLVLVGQEDAIRRELASAKALDMLGDRLTIRHAAEVIDMHDSPTAAVKTKKDSSIAVGLTMHKNGEVDAFLSAGNTGAMLSASTLILGRLKNVGRPTIGSIVPTAKSPAFLVDAGANVDCKPRHLLEFGIMGSIYMSAMQGIEKPRIGLLNIGEEDSKGNETAIEAHKLLSAHAPNFIGNVEGRDVLKGDVDVIVCDGFVGNILLKFGESIPAFLKARFVKLAAQSIANKLIALVARNSLRSVMKELDYQEHGGVPVLGVRGVSIIGHGRSTPKAIKNMIFRAEEMARKKVFATIEQSLLRTVDNA
jgi:glycerol-3-phosphate acyltransferase PlsX